MAIYRLAVQGIRRGDGRSVIAAAAYRAGVQLHDDRLQMDFDFRKKEGIEHREIMAPEGTPSALLQREALWNAAEKADRRKDSVSAQEVLIALPHELNAEQRRELVRAFVRESLVARGMVADFNIHQPDTQGDQRNFHAHILVTTRDVGPEGFGRKNADWHHASFVSDLRHEWARVQNRELERHLGKDAPVVSEKSLAAQGSRAVPQPKMGPSATAMSRRGEASELGARCERARIESAAHAARNAEFRQQMSRKNVRYHERPTGELLQEMKALVGALNEEKNALVAHRETLKGPRPPSKKKLENELTRREVADRRRAQAALKKARQDALTSGISARGIARWFVDPGRAFHDLIRSGHRMLDRLDAARRALDEAERALASKRAWVKSEAGQAHIANLREPAVRTAAERASKRRAVDRHVKRLGGRIEKAEFVVRDLREAKALRIQSFKVPEKTPRSRDRGLNQDLRIASVGRPISHVMAQASEKGIRRVFKSLEGLTIEPPSPTRGRDDGMDR